MKMKIRIRSLIPVCMALAVHTASAQVQPVDYVDMFMGNRGESNCVIGPQLPTGRSIPLRKRPEAETTDTIRRSRSAVSGSSM